MLLHVILMATITLRWLLKFQKICGPLFCKLCQSYIYSPTDALMSCLKINIKIYMNVNFNKIYINVNFNIGFKTAH
jgi:hypothetical protein